MPPKKKAATEPTTPKPKAAPRAKKGAGAVPGSAGLAPAACLEGAPSAALTAACALVEQVGGVVAARYREPLGGHWVALAILPIERVEPTPYQRELSPAHAERLATVIPKVGRFLDPIVAVPAGAGFHSPNGMHRLTAMRRLGAQAITALVVPEPEVAFRILALNTEKAHNLKDKSLEVVRMVRALVADPATSDRPETELQLELEQPGYLTVGVCYEQNNRFSGGAYLPVVSRCTPWSEKPLRAVLAEREVQAGKLLELDEAVAQAVQRLKDTGFASGYLKPVVVARINPLRFIQAKPGQPVRGEFEAVVAKMLAGAKAFDASKVKASDIAAAAAMGGPSDE